MNLKMEIVVHAEKEKVDIEASEQEFAQEIFFHISVGTNVHLYFNEKQMERLHGEIEGVLYEESYKDLMKTIGELEDGVAIYEDIIDKLQEELDYYRAINVMGRTV